MNLESKRTGSEYSAPFQADVPFIFENFDIEAAKCNGFRNTVRCYLTDHILNNMYFNPKNGDEDIDDRPRILPNLNNAFPTDLKAKLKDKLIEKKLIGMDQFDSEKNTEVYAGLPYMLKKGYVDSAFILHDESQKMKEFKKMIASITKESEGDDAENLEYLNSVNENKKTEDIKEASDDRSILEHKWASLKNIFKFQPLWLIRNYFGEYIALYFSFCGVLISSLWLISLIGIAFFIVGMIKR